MCHSASVPASLKLLSPSPVTVAACGDVEELRCRQSGALVTLSLSAWSPSVRNSSCGPELRYWGCLFLQHSSAYPNLNINLAQLCPRAKLAACRKQLELGPAVR